MDITKETSIAGNIKEINTAASLNWRFTVYQGHLYLIQIYEVDGQWYVKVGGTRRDPNIRFKEHIYADTFPQTDMFAKPELFAAVYVNNVWYAEILLHERLQEYAVEGYHELYMIEPILAYREMAEVIDLVNSMPIEQCS